MARRISFSEMVRLYGDVVEYVDKLGLYIFLLIFEDEEAELLIGIEAVSVRSG